jgi:hypothetical protein
MQYLPVKPASRVESTTSSNMHSWYVSIRKKEGSTSAMNGAAQCCQDQKRCDVDVHAVNSNVKGTMTQACATTEASGLLVLIARVHCVRRTTYPHSAHRQCGICCIKNMQQRSQVASAAPRATPVCSAKMWRYVTTHNATTHHMLAAAVLACAGCTRLAWQVGQWLAPNCC